MSTIIGQLFTRELDILPDDELLGDALVEWIRGKLALVLKFVYILPLRGCSEQLASW